MRCGNYLRGGEGMRAGHVGAAVEAANVNAKVQDTIHKRMQCGKVQNNEEKCIPRVNMPIHDCVAFRGVDVPMGYRYSSQCGTYSACIFPPVKQRLRAKPPQISYWIN